MKPASQTAYLTELVVRRIIESGLLPEGVAAAARAAAPAACSTSSTVQDSVAFTGSAHTAGLLRTHTDVLARRRPPRRRGRLAQLLGARPRRRRRRPGVRPVRQGRRRRDDRRRPGRSAPRSGARSCPPRSPTPSSRRSRARLAKVAVGNPADDGVRMGALASASTSATRCARRSQALRALGRDRVRRPRPRRRRRRRRRSAARSSSPVLLRAADRGAVEPHDVEPFGPVSTVLDLRRPSTRRSRSPRAAGAAWSRSVVTHDPDVARAGRARHRARGTAAILRARPRRRDGVDRPRLAAAACSCTADPAAPAAARSSAASAACSTTCSAPRSRPRPTCSPRSPAAGRPGSPRTRRRTCTRSARASPSCAIGDTIVSASRAVTLDDIEHFAEFTGDTFYAHIDEEAARREPVLRRHRRPRLPARVAGGRPVRRPRPGPGARQLRRRQPALPDARSRPATRSRVTLTVKQITPRDDRRLRRGALGRRASPTQNGEPGGDVRRAHAGRQDLAGNGQARLTRRVVAP